MKDEHNNLFYPLALLVCLLLAFTAQGRQEDNKLKIVLIRHAEKPPEGYKLSCQGVNRANALPPVLYAKFGLPDIIYIPQSDTTQHSRMRQTITRASEPNSHSFCKAPLSSSCEWSGRSCPTCARESARTSPIREGWHEGWTARSWRDGGIRLRLTVCPTRCACGPSHGD